MAGDVCAVVAFSEEKPGATFVEGGQAPVIIVIEVVVG